MIRRPPRSTLSSSSAASDVYKRQLLGREGREAEDAGKIVAVVALVGLLDGLVVLGVGYTEGGKDGTVEDELAGGGGGEPGLLDDGVGVEDPVTVLKEDIGDDAETLLSDLNLGKGEVDLIGLGLVVLLDGGLNLTPQGGQPAEGLAHGSPVSEGEGGGKQLEAHGGNVGGVVLEGVGAVVVVGLEDIAEGLSLIHISEPTRLLSISYAVFCLKKKKKI
eukprot:TRINITY_DN13292_c0_g1_i1.p2 TRINITY_DN13292_c0_g1~~TRINITY_DN13292_c0_g1_i1.p2  ORF type:complete len:219 (+),score=64.98 TRINITY_DN13292_c0_g1_i1:144-800(+)